MTVLSFTNYDYSHDNLLPWLTLKSSKILQLENMSQLWHSGQSTFLPLRFGDNIKFLIKAKLCYPDDLHQWMHDAYVHLSKEYALTSLLTYHLTDVFTKGVYDKT